MTDNKRPDLMKCRGDGASISTANSKSSSSGSSEDSDKENLNKKRNSKTKRKADLNGSYEGCLKKRSSDNKSS